MKTKVAILVVIICLIAGVTIGWFWMSSALNTPVSHSHGADYVTIERGSTPQQIIAQLATAGIIRNRILTQYYVRFFRDPSKFQAGDYRFSSPISAVQVLNELESGQNRTVRITIPEGWTRFEIAKRIASNFRSDSNVSEQKILEMMNDTSLIKDFDPTAENLEGYLYPTTYEFPPDTPPQAVVTAMVQQFRKLWKPEWTLEASKRGMSARQIVTIASLIENESKAPNERPVVSSVIYNRLKNGMPLGIDATNVYIAKSLGKWDGVINKSDLEINHPYNTRKIQGLPPGPISSASETAVQAAVAPANTDFLYYVLNVEKNDGSHNFYSSAAEFEVGKQQYQEWLKTQRGKK